MDDVAQYNIKRWQALAEADALFTRPARNLDAASARTTLDPEGRLGDLKGKRVLCLAGGGGKQSVAFALLGAYVNVLDLSEAQLQRDREMAAHYQLSIETMQGDMRDLSRFAADTFDIVWHPYSVNFVPDAHVVFREVARVLCSGGLYHFNCANPFVAGLTERDWDGEGYALKRLYVAGEEMVYNDQEWVYARQKARGTIPPPREYRHTLSTLITGLVQHGFVLLHISDYTDIHPNPEAEPGTWKHFVSVAPPWLTFWMAYRPDVFNSLR